jgi:chemotaxis protein methyltransferase CheR
MQTPLRKFVNPSTEMPETAVLHRPLTKEQFDRLRQLLYRVCAIDLQPGKEQLVKARLWKRVPQLGLSSFDEYIKLVESPAGAAELSSMVDALTTNKTSFFREAQHFGILGEHSKAVLQSRGSLRIWSAGCSSGEEPYTIGMTLHQAIPGLSGMDVRILATDISSRILERARSATYDEGDVSGIPSQILRRFFTTHQMGAAARYVVSDSVRSLVRFARLNLMDPWPMRGQFDFIFCRNVMIYFDAETQKTLIARFYEALRPGGFFFVGHSESLSGRSGAFEYRMPATYQKATTKQNS